MDKEKNMEGKRDIPLSEFSLNHFQRMLDVIAADLSKQRGTEIKMIGREKEPKEKDAPTVESTAS